MQPDAARGQLRRREYDKLFRRPAQAMRTGGRDRAYSFFAAAGSRKPR